MRLQTSTEFRARLAGLPCGRDQTGGMVVNSTRFSAKLELTEPTPGMCNRTFFKKVSYSATLGITTRRRSASPLIAKHSTIPGRDCAVRSMASIGQLHPPKRT
ncbi:MAG TPA: hypothetical protein VGD08_25310 [Stellaceae bacterium]|jgi:hypothetical protein